MRYKLLSFCFCALAACESTPSGQQGSSDSPSSPHNQPPLDSDFTLYEAPPEVIESLRNRGFGPRWAFDEPVLCIGFHSDPVSGESVLVGCRLAQAIDQARRGADRFVFADSNERLWLAAPLGSGGAVILSELEGPPDSGVRLKETLDGFLAGVERSAKYFIAHFQAYNDPWAVAYDMYNGDTYLTISDDTAINPGVNLFCPLSDFPDVVEARETWMAARASDPSIPPWRPAEIRIPRAGYDYAPMSAVFSSNRNLLVSQTLRYHYSTYTPGGGIYWGFPDITGDSTPFHERDITVAVTFAGASVNVDAEADGAECVMELPEPWRIPSEDENGPLVEVQALTLEDNVIYASGIPLLNGLTGGPLVGSGDRVLYVTNVYRVPE